MSDEKPAPDGVNGPKTSGRDGAGESGGGAYPNPHRGTADQAAATDTGGQSDNRYYGPGQIGGEKADKDQNGRVGQGG